MQEKRTSFIRLLLDFYEDIDSNRISLVYEGEVTQEITKAFAALAEKNMDKFYVDTKVKRKVYHVMIECLQNISKHADDTSETASFELKEGLSKNGVFAVGTEGNDWVVISGNIIQEDNIAKTKDLLEMVNGLDKDGLKQLYKEKMRENRISNVGGAGLGFIDIAKKTGNKLEYNFIPLEDKLYFFLLKIRISSSKID